MPNEVASSPDVMPRSRIVVASKLLPTSLNSLLAKDLAIPLTPIRLTSPRPALTIVLRAIALVPAIIPRPIPLTFVTIKSATNGIDVPAMLPQL